jgi:hypothetical protein
MTRLSSQKHSQESSQQASVASDRKPKAKSKSDGGTSNIKKETNSVNQLSSSGGTGSKKRKIATLKSSGTASAHPSGSSNIPKTASALPTTSEDVTNNADFAREMTVARTGTQFAGAGKSGMSKKEQQTQKHESLRPTDGTDSPSLSTGASSTTGADADDDLSPVASPGLAATSTAATSKSGDISDMLETAGTGPSILRLTDPTNPIPQARGKQPNKTFAPAETKKQRQQRVKREAHRAQVEEAEKERRRLLEKQIRGARMAEGSSAQTRTSAFKPPAENAWFSSHGHQVTEATNSSHDALPSLLDTFEPKLEPERSVTSTTRTAPFASVTSRNVPKDDGRRPKREGVGAVDEGVANTAAAPANNDNGWTEDLRFEEEQMRLIQDSEDSWTTVSKRDRKKTSKLLGNTENENSEASGVENRHANGLARKSGASSKPALSSSSNSYHQLGDSGFQDSDWAA